MQAQRFVFFAFLNLLIEDFLFDGANSIKFQVRFCRRCRLFDFLYIGCFYLLPLGVDTKTTNDSDIETNELLNLPIVK